MISASYLLLLHAYAASHHLDVASVQLEHDIDLKTELTADGTISCTAFAKLMEKLAEAANDDAFGLHFVEQLPARPGGVFHHIVFNSRTLRDAFKAISRFLVLVTDAFTIAYQEDDEAGWLVFDFPAEISTYKQFMDGQTALIAVRARQLIADCFPYQVDLTRPEARSKAEFRRVFGIRPAWEQGVCRIGFSHAMLSKPLPTANAEFFASAENYATQLLGLSRAAGSFSETVSKVIASALQRGEASETLICSELGVTVRTLQRSLAGEGTSYKALIEETRTRLARHYLLHTRLSLTAIAFLLGYSELSAFSRAAKTWLGDTPSAMRKRARAHVQDDARQSPAPENEKNGRS